jgi:hypothetical protein
MKVNFNVKRKFIVNGKEYASVEEMPPELREAYEKAMRSGAGVRIDKPQVSVESKIVFNGQEYRSLEAMPEEVRRVYLSVMKSVETGKASPELLSAALGDESTVPHRGATFHASVDLAKPIEPTSSMPRWIIAGVVLLGLVFVLYYLFAD